MKIYHIKLRAIRKAYLEYAPENRQFIRFLKDNTIYRESFRKTRHASKLNCQDHAFEITPMEFIKQALNYAFSWDDVKWERSHQKWYKQVETMETKNNPKSTNKLNIIEKILGKYV